MKPSIVTRGFENAQALRAYVSHRLGFALGRTGRDLHAIHVRLDDINGPRGGNDKQCSIELRVPGRPDVFVRALHTSIHAAIDLAADRAQQALARTLLRSRQGRRNGLVPVAA